MTKPTYKSIQRDRLFFEQYQYCGMIYFEYSGVFRGMPGELAAAQQWAQDKLSERMAWDSRFGRKPPNVRYYYEQLTGLIDHLFTNPDHKLIIGYKTIYVYANDQDFINALNWQFSLKNCKQAVVTRQRGTVSSPGNPHIFRSYLRQRRLNGDQKQWLKNWVTSQTTIKANVPLRKFCQSTKHERTYGHFYIEHSDMSMLSMLGLIIPNLVRETKQIVNR